MALDEDQHTWPSTPVEESTHRWQQFLSVLQVVCAVFMLGPRPRLAAAASLWLYASATARHARLAFILDRYAHILLVWCALRPESLGSSLGLFCALIFRAQLVWVYWDAGSAKLHDPDGGWAGDAPRPAFAGA